MKLNYSLKYVAYPLLLFSFFRCALPKAAQQVNTIPSAHTAPTSMPSKENFHIYIMAGQSNMAGRGIISPSDTISSPRILVLNTDHKWVFAKEPLHHYEPTRTGLDCGLSFGKKLAGSLSDKITIGIVPCAIGGSSIEQWLYDSTYRNVALYTNFKTKIEEAKKSGVIKGILWHQGESNSGIKSYPLFKSRLKECIEKMRKDIGNASLPFYAGLLGSFLKSNEFPKSKEVNSDLRSLSLEIKNMYIIETSDLKPKSDTIHFDSPSQREMGRRFAKSILQSIY